MALTESQMAALGSPCPNFSLKGVDNKRYALKDFAKSKVLVVIFFANHCPYAQAMEDRVIRLNRDYADKGVQVVAICSNDPVAYPDDNFQNLTRRWHEKEYGFPYLWDEKQDVARAFGAACTPDFFVYDNSRTLQYRGRFDDNWKDASKVTRRDLPDAIDALLAGQSPSAEQFPAMGCSIKWREAR
jgi:peroxiredoxin